MFDDFRKQPVNQMVEMRLSSYLIDDYPDTLLLF